MTTDAGRAPVGRAQAPSIHDPTSSRRTRPERVHPICIESARCGRETRVRRVWNALNRRTAARTGPSRHSLTQRSIPQSRDAQRSRLKRTVLRRMLCVACATVTPRGAARTATVRSSLPPSRLWLPPRQAKHERLSRACLWRTSQPARAKPRQWASPLAEVPTSKSAFIAAPTSSAVEKLRPRLLCNAADQVSSPIFGTTSR